MRTTLNLDDDILQAAKELAAKQKRSTGAVLSELARKGFRLGSGVTGATRNGVEMLPARGEKMTLARIRQLMDEEGI